MEKIVDKLKEIIDKNGQDYLADEPLTVYKELKMASQDETMMAGAIMMLIVTDVWNKLKALDKREKISEMIQNDCKFNKEMSDKIAEVVLRLYCVENKINWKKRKNEGLNEFLKSKPTYKWKGFSLWDEGNGTISCHYNAKIKVQPTSIICQNNQLQKLLKKNPFLAKESIYEFYEKKLIEYLDKRFDYYCTCEEYYEPLAEEYELTYDVEEWCKKNGFIVISCEGDGCTDEYEPRFRNNW